MPVLEPSDDGQVAAVDEQHAKPPEDDAVNAVNVNVAPTIEEAVAAAAQAEPHHVEDVALPASVSVGLGRRRGRSGRLGGDKAEAAMVLPSFIWDYFVKDASGKFVICTLCPAQTTRFAYSGGTSTMNRHLRKKHHKYAPGKCAADYEYPRGLHRRQLQQQLQSLASPAGGAVASAASAGLLLPSDTAGVLGSLSPGEPLGGKQRHQLLELRTARRRAASGGAAASKRRKLVVDQAEQAAAIGAAASATLGVAATEFDPAGFVTLPGTTAGAATSGALQFPAGFELNDAAIELDQRFFDYSTLAGAGPTGGVLRGRRHSSSISGNSGAGAVNASVNNATNQKILTHRLLKYLIAQYEPLDVSHMGTELGMLLFGGSTEWPTPGLNFGYGGALGFGGAGMGGPLPKLPSEDTIKLALANLYYSQREILKEVMADVEVLSLSLNNWTSAFGQNVLT
ncbi:hypothetical protein PHYSODRAFT_507768, partial [Phytophthora sojae]